MSASPSSLIASMTGFARAEGNAGQVTWTVEVKSVNGRNLDIRCRFPSGFDGLEMAARGQIQARFKRGSFSVGVNLVRTQPAGAIRLNRAALDQVLEIARTLDIEDIAPARLDGLLSLRGVLETADEGDDADAKADQEAGIAQTLSLALDRLGEARLAEGRHLTQTLAGHLDEIARLAEAAGRTAATQPETLRGRLRAQLASLLEAAPALPEDRIAQEAALLIARADVREELDRLTAHISAARALIAEGGAVGRRFDFLCQEFNREANTLCSKSADIELTRIGLALKAGIEQLREQVQNIE